MGVGSLGEAFSVPFEVTHNLFMIIPIMSLIFFVSFLTGTLVIMALLIKVLINRVKKDNYELKQLKKIDEDNETT